MNTVLALVLLLVPGIAIAQPASFDDCLNDLACLTRELHKGQRLNAEERRRDQAAKDVLDQQERVDRATTVDPDASSWLFYQTPRGVVTNLGDGWMLGPDGLYVPY